MGKIFLEGIKEGRFNRRVLNAYEVIEDESPDDSSPRCGKCLGENLTIDNLHKGIFLPNKSFCFKLEPDWFIFI